MTYYRELSVIADLYQRILDRTHTRPLTPHEAHALTSIGRMHAREAHLLEIMNMEITLRHLRLSRIKALGGK